RAGEVRRDGQRGLPRLRGHLDDRRRGRHDRHHDRTYARAGAGDPGEPAADRAAHHRRGGRVGGDVLRGERRGDRAGDQRGRWDGAVVNVVRINPGELAAASGFSHAVVATGGRTIYLAGQTALDPGGRIVAP